MKCIIFKIHMCLVISFTEIKSHNNWSFKKKRKRKRKDKPSLQASSGVLKETQITYLSEILKRKRN